MWEGSKAPGNEVEIWLVRSATLTKADVISTNIAMHAQSVSIVRRNLVDVEAGKLEGSRLRLSFTSRQKIDKESSDGFYRPSPIRHHQPPQNIAHNFQSTFPGFCVQF